MNSQDAFQLLPCKIFILLLLEWMWFLVPTSWETCLESSGLFGPWSMFVQELPDCLEELEVFQTYHPQTLHPLW